MRKLLTLVLLLAAAPSVFAQNLTTVTSTVKDPNGTVYALGTYTVSLVNTSPQQAQFGGSPNFQQTYSGESLDVNGNLSITLPSNAVITPPGTQWAFNICANPQQIASVFPRPVLPCFISNQTISGSSQAITFTAATIPLPSGSGSGLPAGPTTPNSRAQVLTSTPSGGVGGAAVFGLPGDIPTDRGSGEASYTFAATDIGTSVRETNVAGETFTIPDGNVGAFILPVNIGIIVQGGASTLSRQTSSQIRCTPNGALANSCPLAVGGQYILKETSDFNYTLSVSGDKPTGCAFAGCIWYPFYEGVPLSTGGPSSSTLVSVANQPFLAAFSLSTAQQITKVTYDLVATLAATTGDIGIYGNCTTTCGLIGHTGSFATTAGGVFTTSFASVTQLPVGNYFLATCDSSATPSAVVGNMNSFLNISAAAGLAHTFGSDATDTCTAGVLPNTITIANITNGTSLVPIALLASN